MKLAESLPEGEPLSRRINVLNVSIDRDLLDVSRSTESQLRQSIYANDLPARIVHLVKVPRHHSPDALDMPHAEVRYVPCPVAHWSLFPAAALARGIQAARHERFDLVYVQDPVLTGLAGLMLARRLAIPLVVGVFNDEIDNPLWLSERLLNRVGNPVAKYILRCASAIRTDSAQVANRLSAAGFRNVSFVPFLITNAEAISCPQPRAVVTRNRLLAGRSGPLLLTVARLEPQKNLSLMLRAFKRVVERYPEAVLAVVGDGTLRDSLEAEAAALVPDNVCWLGARPGWELPEFYQAADLFLLSSNLESSARVLTEALLAGRPVLSTDTAGTREVIEDGKSGRVVPVGDVNAFATAALELCRDPERLRRMGQYGRERTEASRNAVIAGMRRIYATAIARA